MIISSMKMHEWSEEEEIIQKLEDIVVENPLIWQGIQYKREEWDNVPVVVPKFVFYMKKYLEGIVDFCKNQSECETTASIRKDFQAKVDEAMRQIEENLTQDKEQKEDINAYIDSVNDKHNDLKNEYDEFIQDSVQNNKGGYDDVMKMAMNYDTVDEPCVSDDEDQYLYEYPRKNEYDLPLKDYKATDKKYKKIEPNESDFKRTTERTQSRLYSFQDLEKVVNLIVGYGPHYHQVVQQERQIKYLKREVQSLKDNDKWLKDYVDKTDKAISDKMKRDKSEQNDLNNWYKKNFDDIDRKNQIQQELMKQQQVAINSNKQFLEQIQQAQAKFMTNLDQLKQDTLQNITNLKEDTRDKIQDIDKFYSESMESLNKGIEEVRHLATDSADDKEKEMTTQMNKQVDEIKGFVDQSITEMIKERKETLSRNEKQFKQIKEVCTNYFNKYDLDLEEIKLRANILEDKYADWSKVLIEPTSLNDARLFSLESRMHEEEEIRIKEYEYLRDLMKKLIYSLEQEQQSLPNKVDLNQSMDSPSLKNQTGQTPGLPNLLNSGGSNVSGSMRADLSKQQPSINLQEQSQMTSRIENLMMVKRLNFLRNSLDSHSPRMTTNKLRQRAQKKRDDRILELWRKDQDRPSVQELIQKIKVDKQSNSNDFNQQLMMVQQNEMSQHMHNLKTNSQLQPISTNPMTAGSTVIQQSMYQTKSTDNKWASNFQKGGRINFGDNPVIAEKLKQSKFNTIVDQSVSKGSVYDQSLGGPSTYSKALDSFWQDFNNDIQQKSTQLQHRHMKNTGHEVGHLDEDQLAMRPSHQQVLNQGSKEKMKSKSKMNHNIQAAQLNSQSVNGAMSKNVSASQMSINQQIKQQQMQQQQENNMTPDHLYQPSQDNQ